MQNPFKFNNSIINKLISDQNVRIGWELEMIVPASSVKMEQNHLCVNDMSAHEVVQYILATNPNNAYMSLDHLDGVKTLNNFKEILYSKLLGLVESGNERYLGILSDLYRVSIRNSELLWDDLSSIVPTFRELVKIDPKQTLEIYVSVCATSPAIYSIKSLNQIFNSLEIFELLHVDKIIQNKYWVSKEKMLLADIYSRNRSPLHYSNISAFLGKMMGVKVAYANVGMPPVDTSKHFCIMKDASIRGIIDNSIGLEITSPPLPVEEAIKHLKTVVDWMKSTNVITNESCGLHFGISLTPPDLMERVSPLKLILLQAESEIAYRFDRYTNIYASTHSDELTFIFNSNKELKDNIINCKNFQDMEKCINPYISYGKYFSANLGKLKTGYVEFRTIGGNNYHLQWESIITSLAMNIHALKLSVSDNPELVAGCVKRLMILLNRSDISLMDNTISAKNQDVITEISKRFPRITGAMQLLCRYLESQNHTQYLYELVHSLCRYSINTDDWNWMDNYVIRKFFKTCIFDINQYNAYIINTGANRDQTYEIVRLVLTDLTTPLKKV